MGSTKHFAARFSLVCAMALALLVAAGAPATSFAEESEATKLQQQADAMMPKVEQTMSAYLKALDEVEDLEEQISKGEEHSAYLASRLPDQRTRTAASIKSLYIFQQSQPGLLELILGADDLNDFISTLCYLDSIHQYNANEVKALSDMKGDLDRTQAQLVAARDEAVQKEAEAKAALDEARAARQELQDRANAIAAAEAAARAEALAAAQAAVEAANRQAALAEEQAAAAVPGTPAPAAPTPTVETNDAGEATFTTSSGNTAVIEVPEEPNVSTEPLTTNTTPAESDSWAARIDAYLAGSPLAGYGSTFAAAAAAYGVDPRLSPAISCIESSKGALCFLPHNAWGWGSSSWSDWESAIYDHVAGLASLYGGTLTLEGAQRYCPPTYQEWYSSVASEMSSI